MDVTRLVPSSRTPTVIHWVAAGPAADILVVLVKWQSLKSAGGSLLAAEARRRTLAASTRQRITIPYQSVSIVPGTGACAAARDLQGHRFLSREAPQLPLPTCPLSACHCAYKQYDDRRQKRRRRSDRTELPQTWCGLERRLSQRRSAGSRE
jgi:hypothetical protein